MRVAAWQYPIEHLASLAMWRDKLARGVAEAAHGGAALLVVPEYASMELTSLFPDATTLPAQMDALQPLITEYDDAYRTLARQHDISIVAGSFPIRCDGEIRNRALVISPTGEVAVEKLQMTRFERETWHVSPGSGQTIISLPDGLRLGVAICYDSEFPLIVRRLAAAGANVIAVPSCTDALAGYYRVRVACQARALENQCYVIQAPTVGDAPWSIAVDANVGAAAIYAPSDRGFPPDGIVAIGELSKPQLVFADLDLDLVEAARRDGLVLGHRDWDLPGHLEGFVLVTSLTD